MTTQNKKEAAVRMDGVYATILISSHDLKLM